MAAMTLAPLLPHAQATGVRCRAYDRRIASDIALPGAIPDADPLPPEIVIRRHAAIPGAGPAVTYDETARTLWRSGTTLHFAPRGIADYRCVTNDSFADTIDITPCVGAAEEEIAALLIATALPGLLWLQGAFVLHAAAVVLPGCDHALAIAARSGTGKSTMLAQLVARGARIVADDSVSLRADRSDVVASGLAGGYFAADPRAGLAGDPATRRFVAVAGNPALGPVALGAILLLSHDAADAPPAFRRLSAFEALGTVLSHRHRACVPALFGDPTQCLADAARIARVPLHAWRRRTGSIPLTDAEWRTLSQLSEGDDHG